MRFFGEKLLLLETEKLISLDMKILLRKLTPE